ncbi:MAG: methylated-DNA--[protein]-cysteine S-methyltransferase [Bacillota bacterium]
MTKLHQDRIDTPKGVFLIRFSSRGIYEICFPGSRTDLGYPPCSLPWTGFAGDLHCYLSGKKVDWAGYPLDQSGYRPFTARLLEEVSNIPYGQVCTYREAAERAGSPLAWRAAGQALKVNRHPVIVPCHRVVGSNNRIGGFSGPPGWKQMLLELEGVLI